MSYMVDKCFTCGKNVTFDENPYENLQATKYWQSSYTDFNDCMFDVLRKIPIQGKKGKMTVRTLHECVTKLYCSPKCGLEDYERNTRD